MDFYDKNTQNRFWSKVDKTTSECWFWLGPKDSGDYACFKINSNTNIRAKKYVWELVNDPIPNKMYVHHTCTNKTSCVNPKHLYLAGKTKSTIVKISAEERFWAKVNKKAQDECWPWTGAGSKCGVVGSFDNTTAQRFCWELHNGKIAGDFNVWPKCQNKLCVNPNHLFLRSGFPPKDPSIRFWKNVNKTETCWLWTGYTRHRGSGINKSAAYGIVFTKGKKTGAHRFSYELHKGPIADGLFVCHTCDNGLCVNPDHLWLGTCADNVHDMINKGRGKVGKYGDASPGVKIPDAKVPEIRERHKDGESISYLAKEFEVKEQTIYSIVTYRSRKSIP